MKGGVNLENIEGLIAGISEAASWVFSLFGDFVTLIQDNTVLFYLVAFSIVAGSIGLVISIVRRFGLKGRRK